MFNSALLCAVLQCCVLISAADARAPIAIPFGSPKEVGWSFNNGQEFPGATGGVSIAPDERNGKPVLKIVGDFTKGGNYVDAGVRLQSDVQQMSMWIKYPSADTLTMRLLDHSGQCHQIRFRIQDTPDWQQIVFPVQRFFRSLGTPGAVTNVERYEFWGGANDGKWHGPATGLHILVNPSADQNVRILLINDASILPPAGIDPSIGAFRVPAEVSLDEVADGKPAWGFSNGQEFPGAKATLEIVNGLPEKGQACLKLAGDFTAGGAYVEMTRDLKPFEIDDLVAVRFSYRTDDANACSVRLIDGTGQCHQRGDIALSADGKWHDLELKTTSVVGGEHWGGANDGKFHGPARLFSFILGVASDSQRKQPTIYIAHPTAAVLQPATAELRYRSDFSTGDPLTNGWEGRGDVAVDPQEKFDGQPSLCMHRSAEDLEKPTSVASAPFKMQPGLWDISVATKTSLHSPDLSYNGAVSLRLLDAAGNTIATPLIVQLFGEHPWTSGSKRITVPPGVISGQFFAELHKADGKFWLTDFSTGFLSPTPIKDNRIDRVVFATAQMGNLLFPGDRRTVTVDVVATRTLKPEQMTLTYFLRDYWGADQILPGTSSLTRIADSNGKITYETVVDLSGAPIEVGKYYELYAQVPQSGDQPFSNYTSLAVLPEADTLHYKPEQIPFTSRNWDNRIGEYFELTNRLGIRVAGVWGGWDIDPPYAPHAPGIEFCEKLHMGVLTGCLGNLIEYHLENWKKIDETCIREGTKNWLAAFGHVRPLYWDQGNEPHGTGEQVLENIKAYKMQFQSLRALDPTVTIIASSADPVDEYFQHGFQQYGDVFDFHIYDGYRNVISELDVFRNLSRKYNCAKPVWSTELGLNSQGMTRQAVAGEMIRKFAVFFAGGGAKLSWFDLLYPDPDGTHGDTAESAENVFDSRYSRYCPKLDAVAYYNLVNAICVKKFVARKDYPLGISDYLMRDADGNCLQIVWQNSGRSDVFLPLTGADAVRLIAIDGTRTDLRAGNSGITLTISEDPLLVLYHGSDSTLPATLGNPIAEATEFPSTLSPGSLQNIKFILHGGTSDQVSLLAPPTWKSSKSDAGKAAGGATLVNFAINIPDASTARQGDLGALIKNASGDTIGLLSVRIPVADGEAR
jgi:hypothetical protein